MSSTRQLAAIMQEDEALAMLLREKMKEKLEAEVHLHGGRIIKFSGDGALCIGIHQADVIFDDSDVHGDGVNIAARLESFAIPGSIFI